MSRQVGFTFIALLLIALGLVVSPVAGAVETVNVSPSVITVGQPITFSGVDIETISPNSPPNNVLMRIYPGFDCSLTPSNAIAFAVTSVNLTGEYTGSYNSTLSFPLPVATSSESYSGSWVATSQYYQNGLPAGSYSIGVTDTEASVNGAAGLCKNFAVVNASSAAEFSGSVVITILALICSMSLLRIFRRKE